MMSRHDPVALIQAWQEAANRQDIERLIELSAPDIEIVGPRGASRGHQVLRDWLGRAGLTLATHRLFARGTIIVAAQHGVWRSAETGEIIGEAELATCFRVDGHHVRRLARYDDLDGALVAAGLSRSDEVTPP